MGCDQRIAWLLTTCRILGPDPVLARRDGFIKALAEKGVHVDSSRVSRWESGLQPLPMRVPATYESVLGAAEGSLVAVVAGLRRAFGNGTTPKDAAGREGDLSDGDVDRLMSLTESGRAHGGQWLRLAGQLNRYDRVYLRKRDWQDLCGQLVSELAASVGVGYVRRYEAAASLIRHPRAQRHLTRALGSFVTHPDTQVVAPVLNLLAEVTDEAAGDLVLRMLGSEHRDLRRAAASVAAVKVARGHFEAEALKQLEPHVVGSLRRGESLDGRLDFFDLAVQLPEDCWDRIQPAVRNRRAFDLVTRSRQGGELVPWTQTSTVVKEVASKVQAETPAHHPSEPDLMLHRLLRESLLHAHKARRHHAALLLAASPYAPAVSRHCLALAKQQNDLLAARAWTVLMRVGHGDRQDQVVLQAMAEPRASIRARALVNVGLMDVPLRPDEAQVLWSQLDGATKPVERQATMFALGMAGAAKVAELAKDESDWPGRSARWWLDQGPARHDPDVGGPADSQQLAPAR
ncbi:hypothetical protein [Nocardioides koreensis]|uniref:hypothetical protein n=1 Tax=Nocardioides koreensis TaxID=433651 RepID=UPI0031CEAB89